MVIVVMYGALTDNDLGAHDADLFAETIGQYRG